MDEKELGSIKGWFAGRLPDGWFTGVDVSVEDDQIVVLGALAEVGLPSGSSSEEKEGAPAGRIAPFREATSRERPGIAQDAEERLRNSVPWARPLAAVTDLFHRAGAASVEAT